MEKLEYYILNCSSEENNNYNINNIKNDNMNNCWISSKFSTYPQIILLKFPSIVLINNIHILIHEKFIPTYITFFSKQISNSNFNNNDDNNIDNNKNDNNDNNNNLFNKIGFIKIKNNKNFNYKVRELRKIPLNITTNQIKITFDKNYSDNNNLFSQIGIVYLKFYGKKINNNNTNIINKNKNNENISNIISNIKNNKEDNFKNLLTKKISEIKEQMKENIKNENYLNCIELKKKLHFYYEIENNINNLQNKKNYCVLNEDFEQANSFKIKIDKIKENITKNIIDDNIELTEENISNILNNSIYGNNINYNINSNNNNSNFNTLSNSMIFTNNNNNNNINVNNNNNNNNTLSNTNNNNNNSSRILNPSKSQPLLPISYDDIILPVIQKKQNNLITSNSSFDEMPIIEPLKEISETLYIKFNNLKENIGKETLNKIFSNNIYYKEEGVNELSLKINKLLKDIISSNNKNEILKELIKIIIYNLNNNSNNNIIKDDDNNNYYNNINTPSIINKYLNLLENIINDNYNNIIIKKYNKILYEILLKNLNDIDNKIRNKSTDLITKILLMFNNNIIITNFFKKLFYNNNNYSLTFNKLKIINNLFDKNFFQKKFIYNNILIDFIILNISNKKSEIRKISLIILNKFITLNGIKSISKKINTIPSNHLQKIMKEIPTINEYLSYNNMNKFKNITSIENYNYIKNNFVKKHSISSLNIFSYNHKNKFKKYNNNIYNNKNNLSSFISSFSNNNSFNSNNSNNNNNLNCIYCNTYVENKSSLLEHWKNNCAYFTTCPYCNNNIEVKEMNNHLIYQCKIKKNFKLCNLCKICYKKEDKHKCNKKIIKNCFLTKCFLCGIILENKEKIFAIHLCQNGCKGQTRKINNMKDNNNNKENNINNSNDDDDISNYVSNNSENNKNNSVIENNNSNKINI